jgi:hypothetical protein
MKATILALPPSEVPVEDQKTLESVQRLIGAKDFQLTACGFFKLNRSMVISLLAAVCSYNVIIVQFQASFGSLGQSEVKVNGTHV